LGYIEGEKAKGNVRPEFMQEFQMVEGDVYAEVARATRSQAKEVGSSHTVGNSLLGSAFKAYSSALAPACPSEQKSGTIGMIHSGPYLLFPRARCLVPPNELFYV
jgi:hypothetical protein